MSDRPGGKRNWLVLVSGLVLAGCGGTATQSPAPPSVSLAAHTSHGLSYSVRITGTGSRQCATATYSSPLPGGRPIVDTSHSCGQPSATGAPVLIQSHTSQQSLITDITTGRCGVVKAGLPGSKLHPLVTRCTRTSPVYRVTILPKAQRLRIAGIRGAPVINFPRHVCSSGICITPLIQPFVPRTGK